MLLLFHKVLWSIPSLGCYFFLSLQAIHIAGGSSLSLFLIKTLIPVYFKQLSLLEMFACPQGVAN